MGEKPRSVLPFVMVIAVAAGLTRMVLRKVKEDREAQAAKDSDSGMPRRD
jgi:hypothetical protein